MLRWLSLTLVAAVPGLTFALDCPLHGSLQVTDDFSFIASSDDGAAGDVVAIDFSLSASNPRQDLSSLIIVGCYDAAKADLIGDPEYSSYYDSVAFMSTFYRKEREGKTGFQLFAGINKDKIANFIPSTSPFPIMTLYFQLKGVAGDSFSVEFCDKTFSAGGGCAWNELYYSSPGTVLDPAPRILAALSTRHVPGEVHILPGPPTRTKPQQAPLARVYAEPPTADTAKIAFELTGAVAKPDAKEVPLDLYITSNYEFCGFSVALKFPQDYLTLARVEEHTRPGVLGIDNTQGTLGMYMANSTRRVGQEGERVHIATLHFDVSARAAEVAEILPTFEPVGPYLNWLNILWNDRLLNPDTLPVNAQVDPLIVLGGGLKIQLQPGYRGDVNFDGKVDLTDAIDILGDLFLGTQRIICPPAADFDGSGTVNISDPIAILNYLFGTGRFSPSRDVDCNS